MPPLPGKRVDKSRNRFYWAWGTTWLAIMAAWGTTGVFNTYNDVMYHSSSNDFYASAQRWNYIRYGAMALLGGTAAYTVFHIYRYLSTASENTIPFVRQERR
jgi:hypothetical protein